MSSKILILIPNDILGGAEQYLKNIVDYFSKNKKYNIYIYILKNKKTDSWEYLQSYENVSINYINEKSERRGLLLLCKKIFSVRKIKFDYIFTSHLYLNAWSGLFKKIGVINTDALICRESTVIFQRFKGLKLKLYKLCYYLGYSGIDLLICQTKNMKTQLVKNLSWIESRVITKVIKNPIVIPNYIDKEINNDINADYIVSAGRLIKEKGFDILIDSFSTIQNQHPNLKLIILGEGPLREELNHQITSLGLKDKVILAGFVTNVYPYFKKAKACIVSSRVEGFPNVLLQMMSQNTRVISTKCAGGIKKIKGVCIVENNNPKELAGVILDALGKDMSNNRSSFNEELEDRSISSFIDKINNNLKILK